MHDVQRLTRAIRSLTAACGVLAFLGCYTIAFAQPRQSDIATNDAATIAHQNGRQQ